MRSFEDERGGHWQAALLEGSYGHIAVVFSRIGGGEILQSSLDAATISEAEQWLAAVDETGLNKILAEASPWQ